MERLGREPIDLELFVLKCHLVVERQLYWLLAHRLHVAERHLPALQYLPLAKLALGGDGYKASLVMILVLNDLRNELGHELDDDKLQTKYAAFCGKL